MQQGNLYCGWELMPAWKYLEPFFSPQMNIFWYSREFLVNIVWNLYWTFTRNSLIFHKNIFMRVFVVLVRSRLTNSNLNIIEWIRIVQVLLNFSFLSSFFFLFFQVKLIRNMSVYACCACACVFVCTKLESAQWKLGTPFFNNFVYIKEKL